jgi:hypothetical protein
MADGATTLVEEKPVTTSVGTKRSTKTGNLILDISHEVETMSKQKALQEAEKLAENVEVSYFKLGGILKLINDNSWFEGFPTFDAFVFETYGFQSRKARYLISIYDNLVTKQIPWEKVQHLGWTKLKDLAPVLTQDNVDEWVAKAENLTVADLLAVLNSNKNAEEGEKTAKTTDEWVKMPFKFKKDQAETVTQALQKAKGELNTQYDTVALENICAAYIGGSVAVQKQPSIEDMIKNIGFEELLTKLADLHPEFDIVVQPATAVANG